MSDNDDLNDADLFGDDDENINEKATEEIVPPKRYLIPRLNKPDERSELLYLKLPNMIGISHRGFDADYYDEAEERQDLEMRKKIYRMNNMIRWRYKKAADGSLTKEKESNSRLVQWSDGSTQLLIGSEAFDMNTVDISENNAFLFAKAPAHIAGDDGQQEPTLILEAHQKLKKRITLKPHDMQSLTHQNLQIGVGLSMNKTIKTEMISVSYDPVKRSRELARALEIKAREERRRALDEEHMRHRRANPDYLSKKYIENNNENENDVYEYDSSENIGNIKAQYKRGRLTSDPTDDDDILDSSDDDTVAVSNRKRKLESGSNISSSATTDNNNNNNNNNDNDNSKLEGSSITKEAPKLSTDGIVSDLAGSDRDTGSSSEDDMKLVRNKTSKRRKLDDESDEEDSS